MLDNLVLTEGDPILVPTESDRNLIIGQLFHTSAAIVDRNQRVVALDGNLKLLRHLMNLKPIGYQTYSAIEKPMGFGVDERSDLVKVILKNHFVMKNPEFICQVSQNLKFRFETNP